MIPLRTTHEEVLEILPQMEQNAKSRTERNGSLLFGVPPDEHWSAHLALTFGPGPLPPERQCSSLPGADFPPVVGRDAPIPF